MLPFDRVISEIRELPLKPETRDKWLGLNAARLLRLGESV
jgi:predicted TIM-barrel fold metal-dependent hydrolase